MDGAREAQAGVALGLENVFGEIFRNVGQQFASVATAMIALNLLIDPPLFRIALTRVGEASSTEDNNRGVTVVIVDDKEDEERDEEKRIIISFRITTTTNNNNNAATLAYISSSIARLQRVLSFERDHTYLFFYSSSASGSFKSLNNFPLFLLSHMLSNPLLTIFSPTKAPAMITPTYTDVFDFIFFEERERRKELINTDDDDEVENRENRERKNTIIIIIISVVYRKNSSANKKKTRALSALLIKLASARLKLTMNVL